LFTKANNLLWQLPAKPCATLVLVKNYRLLFIELILQHAFFQRKCFAIIYFYHRLNKSLNIACNFIRLANVSFISFYCAAHKRALPGADKKYKSATQPGCIAAIKMGYPFLI